MRRFSFRTHQPEAACSSVDCCAVRTTTDHKWNDQARDSPLLPAPGAATFPTVLRRPNVRASGSVSCLNGREAKWMRGIGAVRRISRSSGGHLMADGQPRSKPHAARTSESETPADSRGLSIGPAGTSARTARTRGWPCSASERTPAAKVADESHRISSGLSRLIAFRVTSNQLMLIEADRLWSYIESATLWYQKDHVTKIRACQILSILIRFIENTYNIYISK
jgi:hypothetical protein